MSKPKRREYAPKRIRGSGVGRTSAEDLCEPVMTFRQIADELGISHARVEQLFYRALRKLRQQAPALREYL